MKNMHEHGYQNRMIYDLTRTVRYESSGKRYVSVIESGSRRNRTMNRWIVRFSADSWIVGWRAIHTAVASQVVQSDSRFRSRVRHNLERNPQSQVMRVVKSSGSLWVACSVALLQAAIVKLVTEQTSPLSLLQSDDLFFFFR